MWVYVCDRVRPAVTLCDIMSHFCDISSRWPAESRMGGLQAESTLAPIDELDVRHKLRRFTVVRGSGAHFPILGSYSNLSVWRSMCVTGSGRPTDRDAA